MSTHEVELVLLVSDKSATVLRDAEDRRELAEAVRDVVSDAIRWEGATAFEIRRVTCAVPLLETPQVETICPVTTVDLTPDVRAVVEAAVRQGKRQEVAEFWSMLPDMLPEGTYEIINREGMRGIRKVT